jgi:hypothetical protein
MNTKSSSPSNHKSQYGVFLPLTSVIALAIILIAVIFGYDVVQVKVAAREMRRFADQVCSEASRKAPLERQAFYDFKNQVDEHGSAAGVDPILTKVTLLTASLVIPTSSSAIGTPNNIAVVPPGMSAQINGDHLEFCPVGSDGTPDCASNTGPYIRYYWDSHAASLNQIIPNSINDNKGVISNRYGAGATSMCVFEGELQTWLSGKKKITSVSSFHNYTTGRSGDYSGDPGDPPFEERRPSVMIAIAPYMPVSVENPEFRFHSNSAYNGNPDGANGNYSVRFLGDYSPLHIFSSSLNAAPTYNSYFQVSPSKEGTFLYPFAADLTNTPNCTGSTCDDRSTPATVEEAFTERDQLLAECMNPPILFRNIILSTLVELLSRDGQLRNGTEIVLANPQNRNVGAVTGAASLAGEHRPPIVMVPFNSDLLASMYTLPFLTFDGSSSPAEFRVGYTKAAYPVATPVSTWAPVATPVAVNANVDAALSYNNEPHFDPFVANPSGLSVPVKREQSQITGQLRYCLQLYKGDNGLKRFNLARLDPDVIFNYGFEETVTANGQGYRYSGFQRDSGSLTPLFGGTLDPANDTWDLAPGSDTLNAAELVSVIGSAQLNPGLKWPILPNSDVAAAGVGPYDLRGDILAVIKYWLNKNTVVSDPTHWPAIGGQTLAKGFLLPGLWPSSVITTATTTAPFANTNNGQSNLVLFLHRRLDVGEKDKIRAELDAAADPASLNRYRKIIVVYIPTNAVDDAAIDDIKYAFRIPTLSADISLYDNILLYFSPKNAIAYPAVARYNDPAQPDWVPYRRYYFDRLFAAGCVTKASIGVINTDCPDAALFGMSSPDDNPVTFGKSIFYDMLLTRAPRL